MQDKVKTKPLDLGTHFDVTKHIRLVPPFQEKGVDKYFLHFEKFAENLKWPKEHWTLLLQSVVIGKAREIYTQLSLEQGGGRVERRCWVNFQCWGVLQVWMIVGQGPIALAVGAGGGCLDIFSLIYLFSFLSPSLWVGWLVVLGLTALRDSISIYIEPSPKERENEERTG